MSSSESEFNKAARNNLNNSDSNELIGNPDYSSMLEHFQRGEFLECLNLLEKLENQYPENKHILKFKDDLQIKMSLEKITESGKKEEKRRKKKAIFKMSILSVIATSIVLITFVFSFYFLEKNAASKRSEEELALLTSLQYQAEQLLQAGQSKPANEIIEKMKSINPDYVDLQPLILEASEITQLESDYNTALQLIQENKKGEALIILNEIEEKAPGMWDINQQIDSLETFFEIAESIESGREAFLENQWEQVITAYEYALSLDPSLNDPLMSEQLLQSYLNRIISLLDNPSAAIEDIEKAEEYYRRAVSMAPQSKALAFERENLQKASKNLLVLKFTQIARSNLEDKSQTLSSISEAVSYLRKAANIQSEDTNLSEDLKNAEFYQIAFKSYIEMKWETVITNLKLLTNSEPDYAGGNASILLYEAYYELAKQYASLGLYLDAIEELELAEILAWDDSDNLIKLYQVQVFLGDMFGKVRNYEDAVSYYKYALNAIQANRRLSGYHSISSKLSDANIKASYLQYEDAFNSYQEVLQGIDVIYTIKEMEIGDGICLAFFANENLSTSTAIIEANNLPTSMVFTFTQNLKIPSLVE